MQLAVVRLVVAPYWPTGQRLQSPLPAVAYCPGPHTTAVATTEPAGQAYPAAHGPLQRDTVSPVVLPKYPGSHDPLHADDVSPGPAPYVPVEHGVHDDAPVVEYCPAGHVIGHDDVEPTAHAQPAWHSPLQLDVVAPLVEP